MFWLGTKIATTSNLNKNYLNKTQTALQSVRSKVDFLDNIVAKQELFCDVVGNYNTNVPNLQYIKQNDTLGIIRVWIEDFVNGRFNMEWIKKPLLWNDNIPVFKTLHLSTNYTQGDTVQAINPNASYQEWLNVKLPATAISPLLNNNIFKDTSRSVNIYWYGRLNDQLGDREFKITALTGYTFEKRFQEQYIVVKMNTGLPFIKEKINELGKGRLVKE